jgi:chromosome segregation ATPase
MNQNNKRSLKSQIARTEADIAHIQHDLINVQLDVRELKNRARAGHDPMTSDRIRISALDGRIDTLEVKVQALNARIKALARESTSRSKPS